MTKIETTIDDMIDFLETYDLIGVVDHTMREHVTGILKEYFIPEEEEDKNEKTGYDGVMSIGWDVDDLPEQEEEN